MKRRFITFLLKRLSPKYYNGFIIIDNAVVNFKCESLRFNMQNNLVQTIGENNYDLGEERQLDIVTDPYSFNVIV
ncbi:MAG: hypothetical protein IPJ03_15815 [Ignavibacteriales bacterium]|nr:hypothetical protein [Ignavibacteriales bacterium]